MASITIEDPGTGSFGWARFDFPAGTLLDFLAFYWHSNFSSQSFPPHPLYTGMSPQVNVGAGMITLPGETNGPYEGGGVHGAGTRAYYRADGVPALTATGYLYMNINRTISGANWVISSSFSRLGVSYTPTVLVHPFAAPF